MCVICFVTTGTAAWAPVGRLRVTQQVGLLDAQQCHQMRRRLIQIYRVWGHWGVAIEMPTPIHDRIDNAYYR